MANKYLSKIRKNGSDILIKDKESLQKINDASAAIAELDLKYTNEMLVAEAAIAELRKRL